MWQHVTCYASVQNEARVSPHIHGSVKFPLSTSLSEEACVSGFGPSLLSAGMAQDRLWCGKSWTSLKDTALFEQARPGRKGTVLIYFSRLRKMTRLCVHLRTLRRFVFAHFSSSQRSSIDALTACRPNTSPTSGRTHWMFKQWVHSFESRVVNFLTLFL